MTTCFCLEQKTKMELHGSVLAFRRSTGTRSPEIERSGYFEKHGEQASINCQMGSTMSWFPVSGQTPHSRTIRSLFARWAGRFKGSIAKRRRQPETPTLHSWPPGSRCHRDGPGLPTTAQPVVGASVSIRTVVQQLLHSGREKVRPADWRLQGSLENHPVQPVDSWRT